MLTEALRNDCEYNAQDCCVTKEVKDNFFPYMRSQGYETTYQMTVRLLRPLMYMMTKGVRVDLDKLEQARGIAQTKEGIVQEELNRLCGRELNASSPKQCQEYFYVEKSIKPYRRRKDGAITTDDKAMARLARGTSTRPALREARLVQEIRALRKLRGTYLEITFDPDNRLRCSYNPRGTKFGRLSSSATVFETGTNMQNLPEEFLQFLIPDDGYFFFSLDKRQAEWVVVAHLAQDPQMLRVLEKGLDPHTHTAHLMFNLPHEVILEESHAVGHTTDQEVVAERREGLPQGTRSFLKRARFLIRNMALRQAGKKSNHGLNYDEGPGTFALTNEMLEADSKRVINLYHNAYPGIRATFHRGIQTALRKDRTLYNCFGRKIRFYDAWGGELFRAAYSAIPQSSVVDILNQGLCEIYEDTTGAMPSLCPLMQVHDSILFQYPQDGLPLFEEVLGTCLQRLNPTLSYHGRDFQIETDLKVGLNGRDMYEVVPNMAREKVEEICTRTIRS